MSWLDRFLEETDEAETPRGYVYWSGIACISAIVAPNTWINRKGVVTLSPNVYVLLLGESGLGKGLAISLVKKMVKRIGATRVISGTNTIASIITEMKETESDERTGIPKFKDSRAFIVSGEFATLVQRDERALPTLTEFYDTHYMEDWKASTKHSGKDELLKLNVTFLGGSTLEHFTKAVPKSDIYGGFVGRMLLINEEARHRINPLSDTEENYQFPFEKLEEHLRTLKEVKGGFKYSPQAKSLWDEWYTEVRSKKIHDPTGAFNRLTDNVLKVAMCISLSKSTELLIRKEDLDEAIDKCMAVTVEQQRLFGSGAGESSSDSLPQSTLLVMRTLWKTEAHTITKRKLMVQNYGNFDIYTLERILVTLEASGIIDVVPCEDEVVIRLLPEAIKSMRSLMER